jgi:hypothetical protein
MKIDTSKLTPELITELCKDENVKQILINNGVVKNELEVNRWYKANSGGIAFKSENGEYYGFDADGKFVNRRDYDHYYEFEHKQWNWQPITPQEVETALKNEAVKKYKGVTKIDNTNVCSIGNKYDIELNNFEFFADRNMFTCGKKKVVLFLNGVWAEPKKEETYIKIPLSIITLTDSDKKLGALVKSIAENY